MTSSCRVWRGGADDAAALARLHAQAFDDAWPEGAFASLLSREEVFALLGAREAKQEPEGFLLVRAVGGEAEVLTLCVAPPARRHGLGAALIDAACDVALNHGASELFLEVAQDNMPALALYHKTGFAQVGRRPAYYHQQRGAADAVVMRRPLGATNP